MNLSLYDIANTVADIEAFLDRGGPASPEEEALLTAALDRALGNLLPAKVEGYCKALKAFDAFVGACKEEEGRIAARRTAVANIQTRMKDRLKYGLEVTGREKVQAGTFTVALQNNPPAVEIESEAAVPDEFKVVTTSLNRAAIMAALKEGIDVPGARLTRGQHVRIR